MIKTFQDSILINKNSEYIFINYFYQNYVNKKHESITNCEIELSYISFYLRGLSYIPLFLFFKYEPDLLISFIKNNKFGKFIINDIFIQKESFKINKYLNEIIFSDNLLTEFKKNDWFYDANFDEDLLSMIDEPIILNKIENIKNYKIAFMKDLNKKNLFDLYPFELLVINSKYLNLVNYNLDSLSPPKKNILNYFINNSHNITDCQSNTEHYNTFISFLYEKIKWLNSNKLKNNLHSNNLKKYINYPTLNKGKFYKFLDNIFNTP